MIADTAVIYSNGSQECERMAQLLKALGGEFLEYRLNQHFSMKAFEAEFGEGAPFPQVALGALHIGSIKDTLNYMRDKGLFQ